jgi:hypothetical protein
MSFLLDPFFMTEPENHIEKIEKSQAAIVSTPQLILLVTNVHSFLL